MPKTTSSAQLAALEDHRRRFEELKRELQPLEYFCRGTVLRRMMRCGKAQCACQTDPSKRHGPYFEWTYKANGKTVNAKLTAATAPLYLAASRQHHKLKIALHRLERLSQVALRHQAKLAQSTRNNA